MSESILVPALGESITEATVSKWLKNKGELVSDYRVDFDEETRQPSATQIVNKIKLGQSDEGAY